MRNNRVRILAVATVVAFGVGLDACSNDSGSPADASTETGLDAGRDVKVPPDTGALDVAMDDVNEDAPQFLAPECTVPAEAGSGGTCITTNDGGVECNPVTSSPCNIDAGESCDYQGPGFHCYVPPPANTAPICGTCDDNAGPACGPTGTCVPVEGGAMACARFCCDNTDCGEGTCTKGPGQAVGLCLQ
jgi:hypothetical protein